MKSPYTHFHTSDVAITPSTADLPAGKGFPAKLLLVVVVLGLFFFYTQAPVAPDNDYIDDEIVEPDEKDDTEKVDLKGTYLVRIYETEAKSDDEWFVSFMQDDAFWFDWVESKDMRIYTYDPESNSQAESFVAAASKDGVKPPFVIHASNGKVLSVTAVSDGMTTDDIKTVVQSKGK